MNPLEQQLEVRVLDSTYYNDTNNFAYLEAKKFVGETLKLKNIELFEKTILIYDKEENNFWRFNNSDVQVLLPIEFTVNGYRLGYGDRLEEYEVCGFDIDNDVNFVCSKCEDYKNSEYPYIKHENIENIRKERIIPLKPTTLEGKECLLEIEGVKYSAKLSIK